jgi:anti-sigma factor RsiW
LIAYVLEAGPFAPELHSDGLIAYKDGHLCAACESVVEASLATRRTATAAATFTSSRGPT